MIISSAISFYLEWYFAHCFANKLLLDFEGKELNLFMISLTQRLDNKYIFLQIILVP